MIITNNNFKYYYVKQTAYYPFVINNRVCLMIDGDNVFKNKLSSDLKLYALLWSLKITLICLYKEN